MLLKFLYWSWNSDYRGIFWWSSGLGLKNPYGTLNDNRFIYYNSTIIIPYSWWSLCRFMNPFVYLCRCFCSFFNFLILTGKHTVCLLFWTCNLTIVFSSLYFLLYIFPPTGIFHEKASICANTFTDQMRLKSNYFWMNPFVSEISWKKATTKLKKGAMTVDLIFFSRKWYVDMIC